MQLIGLTRLGRDAELRYLADNTAVSNLSLAFNYGRKGEDGNKPTQWVEASLWGKQAEALVQYLQKGKQLCVTIDEPHIESFTKADGSVGTKLTGRISALEFAASPQQGQQGGAEPRQQAPRQQPPRQQPAQQRAAQPQRQHAQNSGSGFDDMDDDIPF